MIDNFTFEQILTHITTLENGIVEADMRRHGIVYATSYGVSVVHLRELAKQLSPSNELAKRLWANNWRETQILAGLVAIPETLDEQTINSWVNDCNTSELAEELAINLCVRLPQAPTLAAKWCAEKGHTQAIGFLTAAHLLMRRRAEFEAEALKLMPFALQSAARADATTKRSISIFLRRFVQKIEASRQEIKEFSSKLILSENLHARWIGQDVQIELENWI